MVGGFHIARTFIGAVLKWPIASDFPRDLLYCTASLSDGFADQEADSMHTRQRQRVGGCFISAMQVVYAACRSGTTARGRLDPAVHDEVTCTPLVRGRGVSSYELLAAALITWKRAVSALAWAKLTQAFDMSSRSSARQISPISIEDGVYTKSTSDDLTWLSGALTASVRLRRMYVALHTFLRSLSSDLPRCLWSLGILVETRVGCRQSETLHAPRGTHVLAKRNVRWGPINHVLISK